MIEYHGDLARVSADDLKGFFAGWPHPPPSETHRQLLDGSSHFVVAVPEGSTQVVGYITAISDGVLSAYISQLEVLAEHRGRGIGSALVRAMLERLEGLYMIDLICDVDVQPFYERLGLTRWSGMILRNYAAQSGA